MNELTSHANIPLLIAARIEKKHSHSDDIWLRLPMTKKHFNGAVNYVCDSWDNLRIGQYYTTIPDLSTCELMETPLSVINHLAVRLNKLTDEQAITLTALLASYPGLMTVDHIIDYTYNTDRYELEPEICDYWMLGRYRLDELDLSGLQPTIVQSINTKHLGLTSLIKENGYFTSLGYLSSKDGWRKMVKRRSVPTRWDIKGKDGEEIFGERRYMDIRDSSDDDYVYDEIDVDDN